MGTNSYITRVDGPYESEEEAEEICGKTPTLEGLVQLMSVGKDKWLLLVVEFITDGVVGDLTRTDVGTM